MSGFAERSLGPARASGPSTPDDTVSVSAQPKENAWAETNLLSESNGFLLPFRSLGCALKDAPPEPDWLWEGYLAPGALSLLAGRPKVGKSTLVFGLFGAIARGAAFLDRATRRSGMLLLSEERPDTLEEKRSRFDLPDDRIHLLMRHQARGVEWPTVIDQAVAYATAHDLGLLVIDTFDKWSGLRGDDESKAGPVLEALEPLTHAAGAGLAVLIVAHQRKAAGAHGEAVRGSNALTGAVDVIVELERVSGEKSSRVLRAESRYAATPDDLAAELEDNVYRATTVGDLKSAHELEMVQEALASPSGGDTVADMAAATSLARSTVQRRLEQLVERDTIERLGSGKRGDPYRFRFVSAQPHFLGQGRNDNGDPRDYGAELEQARAKFGDGS